jgi:hypothetical protein
LVRNPVDENEVRTPRRTFGGIKDVLILRGSSAACPLGRGADALPSEPSSAQSSSARSGGLQLVR